MNMIHKYKFLNTTRYFEIEPQDAGKKFCMFKFEIHICSITISSFRYGKFNCFKYKKSN